MCTHYIYLFRFVPFKKFQNGAQPTQSRRCRRWHQNQNQTISLLIVCNRISCSFSRSIWSMSQFCVFRSIEGNQTYWNVIIVPKSDDLFLLINEISLSLCRWIKCVIFPDWNVTTFEYIWPPFVFIHFHYRYQSQYWNSISMKWAKF